MSSTLKPDFNDLDILYKQEQNQNSNAIHINRVLSKNVFDVPLKNSTTDNICSGYFRSNSSSNVDSVIMDNNYPLGLYCFDYGNESSASTTYMNKENKFRDRASSVCNELNKQLQEVQEKPGSQINWTRYKTELCRPFEENGSCKYGEKCQFAHGYNELRNLSRHPKFKTEPCRTFHTTGFCPYGPRCHFIHNADERRLPPSNAHLRGQRLLQDSSVFGPNETTEINTLSQNNRPKLQHSLSFSGFPNPRGFDLPFQETLLSRTPPPRSLQFYEDEGTLNSSSQHNAFSVPEQYLGGFIMSSNLQTQSGYISQPSRCLSEKIQTEVCPPPPPFNMSDLMTMLCLAESQVIDYNSITPDSVSEPDSYGNRSCDSSGSLSGSESPSLDTGKRLPIFSRLSITDD